MKMTRLSLYTLNSNHREPERVLVVTQNNLLLVAVGPILLTIGH